ncbi:Uncharacterised protein [Mycobacteroides abscessus subsp. abscessus]|nr:Uncharacterised protein [Mycobacteroides abscessus subsp. abscessus]
MGTGRGVQPGVVAVGLHPADRAAVHQRGDTAQFHRDHLVGILAGRGRLRGGGTRLADPAHGLGQPRLPQRLEQIVHRAQVEGAHRAVVVRGHEHHRGRVGELREDARQLHAVQPRHVDVEEDRVDGVGAQQPQRAGGVGGGMDLADLGPGAQQVHQLAPRPGRSRCRTPPAAGRRRWPARHAPTRPHRPDRRRPRPARPSAAAPGPCPRRRPPR